MAEGYHKAIKCLKGHTRITNCEHVCSILQTLSLKAHNGKELRKLYDLCSQHIRVIKATDTCNIDTFLTIIMELKLDEVTKLKWMEYSNDSQMTPPNAKSLKFLDLQFRHFESVPPKRKL